MRTNEAGGNPNDISRRQLLLRGAAGAATLAATGIVVACGGSSQPSGPPQNLVGKGLVPASDVPVGGGTVLANDRLVVTQPSQGSFRVFSAICTHRGCTVNQVSGGAIHCPCHGSQFSILDGSVRQGPATSALPEYGAKVQAGYVALTSRSA